MFSLLKISSHLNLLTACFAASFYFYYSTLMQSFQFGNLIFAFGTTLLAYEYLQAKAIHLLSIVLLAVSFCFLQVDHILQYAVAAFLLLAYELKLRENFILKPLVIALSWTLLIDLAEFKTHIFIILESFVLTLCLALPFDIRDYITDKYKGLKSLVVVFGIKNSKLLCIFLWGVLLVLKSQTNESSIEHIVFLITISLYYLFLLKKIRPQVHLNYTNLYLDGIYLVQLLPLIWI